MADQLEVEAQIVQQLLNIGQEFRLYYELHSRELNFQLDKVSKLWTLSQRHAIAASTLSPSADQRGNRLNEFNGVAPNQLLLTEYNKTYQQILGSIETLKSAVCDLRSSYESFKDCYAQLNCEQATALVTGDAHIKPIAFFVEFVDDTFKYFQYNIVHLGFHAGQVKPTDVSALDSFKKILVPNEEFNDSLMTGLTYCKCLQHITRKPISTGGSTPQPRSRKSAGGPAIPTSVHAR